MYKQYSDATYRTEVTKPGWLGYLGPLIAAELGDTVIIHLRNIASRPYSIHPHGLNYSKSSEGEQYVAQWYISAWIDYTVIICVCRSLVPRSHRARREA